MLRSSGSLGSIHDLDHAPEAPVVSSLVSPRNSPNSTSRSTRSLFAVPSSLHLRLDQDMDHSEVAVPTGTTRRRLDSAPGRLNYISEVGEHEHEHEHSEGEPSPGTSPPQSHSRAWMSSNLNRTASESNVNGSTSSLNDHDIFLEQDHDHDDDDEFLALDRMDNSDYVADSTINSPRDRGPPRKGISAVFKLPLLQYVAGCGMTRITACLVRNAPCFWFCGSSMEVGATDRSILYRLNILCAFFALGHVAAGVFLLIVLHSNSVVDRYNSVVVRTEDSTSISLDLWNLNGSVFLIGILGLIILFTVLCTLKIVREVNLRGAVRYLWTMLWLLPLQIFFVISLFDYHRVTQVWVRHWWYLPSMAWFRRVFCADGTYNTLCVVPIGGGEDSIDELQWCSDTFNATNCTEIRDLAQQEATRFMIIFYSISGGKYMRYTTAACIKSINVLTLSPTYSVGDLLDHLVDAFDSVLGSDHYQVSAAAKC